MTGASEATLHRYQWLGNCWRCLTCDVQIRNRDCPHNEQATEQIREWQPIVSDGPGPSS